MAHMPVSFHAPTSKDLDPREDQSSHSGTFLPHRDLRDAVKSLFVGILQFVFPCIWHSTRIRRKCKMKYFVK